MLVCVFVTCFAHETAGAARVRHSLLPLLSRDNETQTSGTSRRENTDVYLVEFRIGSRPGTRILPPSNFRLYMIYVISSKRGTSMSDQTVATIDAAPLPEVSFTFLQNAVLAALAANGTLPSYIMLSSRQEM